MQIFDSIVKTRHATGIALGFFDGVHLGHQAVITRCVDTCTQNGCVPCVLTFKKSPAAMLSDKKVPMITDNSLKFSMIKSYGTQRLYCVDFESIRDLTAEQFVRDILHNKLNARFVFCGYNYHFGVGGTANADTLQTLCEQYNIKCIACDRVMLDDTAVSSTAIRHCISSGDIEKANAMLGYEFSFDLTVVSGNHIGKTISTPTINQPIPDDIIKPKFGVYATRVTIDNTVYHGATNIGIHPTVGACAPVCETYIFDYNGSNIYSKKVKTCLCKFIRPEQRFDSIDALSCQIYKDKQTILSYFNINC